ncbi:MAG: hypothetical protein OEM49_01410 [Myxococcales bacterium]|nr:hypothetical protein [Myxococcales bacterium]MDH5305564.1 hypothetical protein [Myxococcales bacterium]MDH5565195.1 hypothetical protein [Myxococcales bacterium]
MSAMRHAMDGRNAERLHAYHDGELSGLARRRFERQLRRRPELRSELRALAALRAALRELDAAAPAPDLWREIAPRLPAIDARARQATRRDAERLWFWLPRPVAAATAAAAAAALVVAVAVGLLWPQAPQGGQVVRWIDGGARSVMVLDDDPDTTIIWVLDASLDEASTGGSGNVV